MGTGSISVIEGIIKTRYNHSLQDLFIMDDNKNKWLKSKGYLHITPQIDIGINPQRIISKIQSEEFVSTHSFYPLIHAIIKERKFKKVNGVRTHSFFNEKKGVFESTAKKRPLHYSTHIDALIFGYYSELLQVEYDKKLKLINGLDDVVIAYRKIPIDKDSFNSKGKSTIHFSNEVFEEIKNRVKENDECVVLTFDIKSFFSSLNHRKLFNAWADLMFANEKKLPPAHYNVFKACTRFSYIMKDDLRIEANKGGRKSGFDEKKLSFIRNNYGKNCFFESYEDFRSKLKSGELKIYNNQFWDKKNKCPIGIPQGLPISSILANLYLLDFDTEIVKFVMHDLKGYYRRYSDDIVIVCTREQMFSVEECVKRNISKCELTVSEDKTEKFIFKNEGKLKSYKILENDLTKLSDLCPLIYLGFEFNGTKVRVKSSNMARFYRRMAGSVRKKAKRAYRIAQENGDSKIVIFRSQLKRTYLLGNLKHNQIYIKKKSFVKLDNGMYRLEVIKHPISKKGSYSKYIERVSEIMKDDDILKNFERKQKHIFNKAIHKQICKYKNRLN